MYLAKIQEQKKLNGYPHFEYTFFFKQIIFNICIHFLNITNQIV